MGYTSAIIKTVIVGHFLSSVAKRRFERSFKSQTPNTELHSVEHTMQTKITSICTYYSAKLVPKEQ